MCAFCWTMRNLWFPAKTAYFDAIVLGAKNKLWNKLSQYPGLPTNITIQSNCVDMLLVSLVDWFSKSYEVLLYAVVWIVSARFFLYIYLTYDQYSPVSLSTFHWVDTCIAFAIYFFLTVQFPTCTYCL